MKPYRFGHPGSGCCELQQKNVSQADRGCSEGSQQASTWKRGLASFDLLLWLAARDVGGWAGSLKRTNQRSGHWARGAAPPREPPISAPEPLWTLIGEREAIKAPPHYFCCLFGREWVMGDCKKTEDNTQREVQFQRGGLASTGVQETLSLTLKLCRSCRFSVPTHPQLLKEALMP